MPSTAIRSQRRQRRTINEINMVPFIDVMLVLLIIFMVTAPLIAPSLIDLPSVGRAGKAPDQVIEVLIAKDAQVSLKLPGQAAPQVLALRELGTVAARAQAQYAPGASAFVISADRSVAYETVVSVMEQLQRAGVARVGLAVQLNKP